MKPLTLFLAIIFLSGCNKELDLSSPKYGLELPAVTPSYNINVKHINNNIPALGRVLFYDVRLSETNDISCGSCHIQKSGFADNQALSRGVLNHVTSRNTMSIANNGKNLFWDGRKTDLKEMVLLPIVNPSEMGVKNLKDMVDELNKLPYYRDLAFRAYGFSNLTENNVADALSWFVRSIQPNGSRFDQHLKVAPVFITGVVHKKSPFLSDQEMEGMVLFLEKYNCNRCHNLQIKPALNPNALYWSPNANDDHFANIGLDAVSMDKGRQEFSGWVGDAGKFRVPSLRNIALTAPYMHDGRFATLSEVIDHYSDNIKYTPNLDQNLLSAPGIAKKFAIDDREKMALIAFLNTLTDENVTTNPKWSDPFRK